MNKVYPAIALITILLIGMACTEIALPRLPGRPILSRVELQVPKSAEIDSFQVEIELKKGRYDLYLVTETVKKYYTVKAGESVTDLLNADALLGDPDRSRSIASEYISLPIKVKLIHNSKTLSETKSDIDCFAGFNVPNNEAVPLNNLGTLTYREKQ
ncbi:MAG: hypothetical protein AAFP70_05900 [Calditrichota bacterium]